MEPKPTKNFLLISFFLLALYLVVGKGGAADDMLGMCNGSAAAFDRKGEILMESDISHRILEQQSHITYGALKRDQPACGSAGRGGSYKSCYPDPSNPYSRGCSRIYRCRDDS